MSNRGYKERLSLPPTDSDLAVMNYKVLEQNIDVLNKSLLAMARTVNTLHTKIVELERLDTTISELNNTITQLSSKLDVLETNYNNSSIFISNLHEVTIRNDNLLSDNTAKVKLLEESAEITNLNNTKEHNELTQLVSSLQERVNIIEQYQESTIQDDLGHTNLQDDLGHTNLQDDLGHTHREEPTATINELANAINELNNAISTPDNNGGFDCDLVECDLVKRVGVKCDLLKCVGGCGDVCLVHMFKIREDPVAEPIAEPIADLVTENVADLVVENTEEPVKAKRATKTRKSKKTVA